MSRREAPFVKGRLSDKNRTLRLMRKIQDIHVLSIDALIAPKQLKDQLPVDEAIVATVVEARETIRKIIRGADRRMLCIVGPCSIHDPECALDFAERLRKLKDAVADQLYVVMRVYFEKPRTTVGWKGLINDPHMDDSCDITEGLRHRAHAAHPDQPDGARRQRPRCSIRSRRNTSRT